MKTHTNGFKTNIKTLGRELDSKITYTINSEEVELGAEELNSITPHYEGGILKSVMRQLDIDSRVEIPVNTEINYKFGIKVEDEYEYLDFGNYIVYSVEKQEDTTSYKIVCYDKMLFSMVDYQFLGITYPITIRNYINTICTHLGLTFKNANDTFANYDREINEELYLDTDGNSIGYTFRDVFDELAQVTASTICINENDDELEIRYINETNDTIDEEYLKDVNVNFGQKYGPINSIVLTRAGGSDSIFLRDEQSVAEDGLCEIKIEDNQIMNWNDRADYLEDILESLDGLEYYLNDFSSTGVCYYNLCDRYNVSIDNTTYSCVMFNDEIDVTQGLEEKIHTDLPEETQTDYKHASKDDRQASQAYVIVKKNEAQVEALSEKIEITAETTNSVGSLTLENAFAGTLHYLSIKGQMSLLFPQNQTEYGYPLTPHDGLKPSNTLTPSSPVPYGNDVFYPSNSLYPKDNILLVDDIEYKLDIDFLNYINSTICDEFIYEEGKCKIIRRVGIDSGGNKYALIEEVIENRKDIDIKIQSNSIIKMKSFNDLIYSSTYLIQNEYTETFVPSVDLISRINLSPGNATIQANKIKLEGYTTINENFGVDLEGNMWARNGSFSGDIYLENGNKVIGGDGLLSVLVFDSAGFSGVSNWGVTGYQITTDQWEYTYTGWQNLNDLIDYYIPNNFTVTEAYVLLNCTPLLAPIDQNTTVIGLPKELKLFSVSGVGNDQLSYYWNGSVYITRDGSINGTEVESAFGKETYTPNISNMGDVSQVISKNIGQYLLRGQQANLTLTTTTTPPPFELNEYDAPTTASIINACQKTGATKMRLYVYGYMSMESEDDN